MLDVLMMEVLVLTVGQAVWPSVGRSARRALNTWSGWWTGGRSNEEEPMAMAMNIQFTGEDVPQGSSIDISKSQTKWNDDDNVENETKTKGKAAPGPVPGPRVDSSSKHTAKPKANNIRSTSTSRVEPALTMTLTDDTPTAIIANGIKAAEAFKTGLAKAQKGAASKAKARANASDTRMEKDRDNGYAYEYDYCYGHGGYGYDYGYGSYTIAYGPSGNQVSSAASGDFINSALEKARHFQMDLARAQGEAVLKQYYY